MKRSDFKKMRKVDKNSLIGKTIKIPGVINLENEYISIKVKKVVFAVNYAFVIINDSCLIGIGQYNDLCDGIDITRIV